jgi:type VI secretion system secreted protein VgrG
VTVTVQLRDDAKRHFNGFVSRFGAGRHQGRYFAYQATVSPWLWFLTRTSDCRIFQDLTVPDIVKKVFEDHGIAKFEFKTFRTYRKWVYCVQYRESDYNFVARLLEHEGIYWYFEHGDGQHKLILVDSQSAHDAAKSCESLPYVEQGADTGADTDCVSDWRFSQEVRTGKVALTSYDFERPSTDLKVDAKKERKYTMSDYEVFDFDGDYIQKSDGKQLADDHMDELQTPFQALQGASNAQGIEVGRLLTLTKHPRADQNAQYLITSLQVSAHVDAYESGNAAGDFRCDFSAIPAAQQFRPTRRTPKPFVQGPQTAVVVGPSGEELFTTSTAASSCTSTGTATARRTRRARAGCASRIPGPARTSASCTCRASARRSSSTSSRATRTKPIITGRVHNAEQMPPWDLPANATQSGILTRSSKGGGYGNANAIRFEDKKGSEQLWIHAEKNQDIEVENDETHWVGHDRTKTIDHDETTHVKHDRTETVDNNETITVHGNRTETVDKDETITIHKNRTENVDLNESITIGVNRTENVGANEAITIGSNRTISVGASETATVALQRTHAVGVNETIAIGAAQEVVIGALQSITVGANQTTSVGASQTNTIAAKQTTSVGAAQDNTIGADRKLTVGGAQTTSVAKARTTSVGQDDKLSVGKNLVISAADSVSITTGSASITMKKDGTISIKGKDITIDGSGKINVKASSDIVMTGKKIGTTEYLRRGEHTQ